MSKIFEQTPNTYTDMHIHRHITRQHAQVRVRQHCLPEKYKLSPQRRPKAKARINTSDTKDTDSGRVTAGMTVLLTVPSL